jgi:hypothetical protein
MLKLQIRRWGPPPIRVTRWVCEKVAPNVVKAIFVKLNIADMCIGKK